jgi:hypothetical protein
MAHTLEKLVSRMRNGEICYKQKKNDCCEFIKFDGTHKYATFIELTAAMYAALCDLTTVSKDRTWSLESDILMFPGCAPGVYLFYAGNEVAKKYAVSIIYKNHPFDPVEI